MKRYWIDYSSVFTVQPMTYWVHGLLTSKQIEESVLRLSDGWPTFCVELDDFIFRFASLQELDHCIETLSKKVLPQPSRLAAARRDQLGHANQHWLSRLPAAVKSWKYREKVVRLMSEAREEFVAESKR